MTFDSIIVLVARECQREAAADELRYSSAWESLFFGAMNLNLCFHRSTSHLGVSERGGHDSVDYWYISISADSLVTAVLCKNF